MPTHSDTIHRLYAAIEAEAPAGELAAFFHPDAEQVEFPSLVRPAGHRRALPEMLAGAEAGRALIASQRFEVHTVVTDADRAAVQLTWTATTRAAVSGLPAGSRLVAHVAAFYVFRDGLVLRQSSYDCYEPLPV